MSFRVPGSSLHSSHRLWDDWTCTPCGILGAGCGDSQDLWSNAYVTSGCGIGFDWRPKPCGVVAVLATVVVLPMVLGVLFLRFEVAIGVICATSSFLQLPWAICRFVVVLMAHRAGRRATQWRAGHDLCYCRRMWNTGLTRFVVVATFGTSCNLCSCCHCWKTGFENLCFSFQLLGRDALPLRGHERKS